MFFLCVLFFTEGEGLIKLNLITCIFQQFLSHVQCTSHLFLWALLAVVLFLQQIIVCFLT